MRKVARVRIRSSAQPEIVRLMICEADVGYYLFMFDGEKDGPCLYDSFFQDAKGAEDSAASAFGVRCEDWKPIPDYPKGCQQDWIAPTRRIVGADGKTQFAKAENADLNRHQGDEL